MMPCTTHHYACDCREADYRRLREAAMRLAEAYEGLYGIGCFYLVDATDTVAHVQMTSTARWSVSEIRELCAALAPVQNRLG